LFTQFEPLYYWNFQSEIIIFLDSTTQKKCIDFQRFVLLFFAFLIQHQSGSYNLLSLLRLIFEQKWFWLNDLFDFLTYLIDLLYFDAKMFIFRCLMWTSCYFWVFSVPKYFLFYFLNGSEHLKQFLYTFLPCLIYQNLTSSE